MTGVQTCALPISFARGSWAVVPPGHAQARLTLRDGIGGKLFFAGEALSREQWGTVGGAYEQGIRAAEAVRTTLEAATSA